MTAGPAGGRSVSENKLLPENYPELNPVENIWQFMRDNWLYNRVLTSYNNIVDYCCEAWNRLID